MLLCIIPWCAFSGYTDLAEILLTCTKYSSVCSYFSVGICFCRYTAVWSMFVYCCCLFCLAKCGWSRHDLNVYVYDCQSCFSWMYLSRLLFLPRSFVIFLFAFGDLYKKAYIDCDHVVQSCNGLCTFVLIVGPCP